MPIKAWCLWWCYCDRWLTRCFSLSYCCFIHGSFLYLLKSEGACLTDLRFGLSYLLTGETSAAGGAGESQKRKRRREAPCTAAQGLTHTQEVSFIQALIHTHVALIHLAEIPCRTTLVIKLIASKCISFFSWCRHSSPLPGIAYFAEFKSKDFPLLKYVIMWLCILLLYCFHIISHNCHSHFLLRCGTLE